MQAHSIQFSGDDPTVVSSSKTEAGIDSCIHFELLCMVSLEIIGVRTFTF